MTIVVSRLAGHAYVADNGQTSDVSLRVGCNLRGKLSEGQQRVHNVTVLALKETFSTF